VLPFNQRMASMTAEDFINSILIEGLDIRYLVVGDDFRFGKDRMGDFQLLEKTGKENNFTVVSMPSFRIDGERVSSSGIRSALAEGDFDRAERLLGRHYHMAGKVAHGDKRGRQWGFPTANINMKRKVIPLRGIFAVEVFGLDHEPVFGVANLGTRPTVCGMRTLLEVHLFDFDEQIYGRRINVLFRHKIREEVRFDSFDELKAQIGLDVISAREYFSAI
jgi:riboflavin kinase / FMN adenylyltransferase